MPDRHMAPKRLAGSTWLITGTTNAGFREGCLIDTGCDLSVLAGLKVEEVVLTHGHADHFRCAAALRERGARVWAPRQEAPLVENPEINIRGMFSWALPSEEMVTRLFKGEGCPVDRFLEEWDGRGVTPVPLPGHTVAHTGFLTDDGVLFAGDSFFLKELLDRFPLPYTVDIGLAKRSLEGMTSLDFEWLVPAHGRPVSRAESEREITYQLEWIAGIEHLMMKLLGGELTTEQIIGLVSGELGLEENPAQYWLAVTTVKGFLADLLRRGMIGFSVHGHAGYWRAC